MSNKILTGKGGYASVEWNGAVSNIKNYPGQGRFVFYAYVILKQEYITVYLQRTAACLNALQFFLAWVLSTQQS